MIIDQLPTISNVQNSDELPIERGQTTYKTTVGEVVGAVSKIVADEYDNTSTYAVGDYCVYEGTLYICNSAISTAEEWNASHWTATNVTDEIPTAYTSNPEMDGTASPGSSTSWAKGDHVHPHDTSKADTGLGITNAAVGDLVRISAVDANNKPTAFEKVAVNEIKCNDNLLDNWYFANPVNQRGQASYSNTGYTIDRWWCIFDTVTVLSDGLQLSTDSGVSYPGAFRNAVTSPKSLAGKTVTLSILVTSISTGGEVKLSAARATGINAGMVSEISALSITSTGLYSKTATLSSNVGSAETPLFFVSISTIQGTTAKVQAIKLELGSEQTLAHQDNGVWVLNEIPVFSTEFAKCQEYFYRLQAAYAILATGVVYGSTRCAGVLQVPVKQKNNVTCSYNGALYLAYNGHEGANAVAIPSIQLDCFGGFLRIIGQNMTGLTPGEACQFQFRDNTSYIDVSIEP